MSMSNVGAGPSRGAGNPERTARFAAKMVSEMGFEAFEAKKKIFASLTPCQIQAAGMIVQSDTDPVDYKAVFKLLITDMKTDISADDQNKISFSEYLSETEKLLSQGDTAIDDLKKEEIGKKANFIFRDNVANVFSAVYGSHQENSLYYQLLLAFYNHLEEKCPNILKSCEKYFEKNMNLITHQESFSFRILDTIKDFYQNVMSDETVFHVLKNCEADTKKLRSLINFATAGVERTESRLSREQSSTWPEFLERQITITKNTQEFARKKSKTEKEKAHPLKGFFETIIHLFYECKKSKKLSESFYQEQEEIVTDAYLHAVDRYAELFNSVQERKGASDDEERGFVRKFHEAITNMIDQFFSSILKISQGISAYQEKSPDEIAAEIEAMGISAESAKSAKKKKKKSPEIAAQASTSQSGAASADDDFEEAKDDEEYSLHALVELYKKKIGVQFNESENVAQGTISDRSAASLAVDILRNMRNIGIETTKQTQPAKTQSLSAHNPLQLIFGEVAPVKGKGYEHGLTFHSDAAVPVGSFRKDQTGRLCVNPDEIARSADELRTAPENFLLTYDFGLEKDRKPNFNKVNLCLIQKTTLKDENGKDQALIFKIPLVRVQNDERFFMRNAYFSDHIPSYCANAALYIGEKAKVDFPEREKTGFQPEILEITDKAKLVAALAPLPEGEDLQVNSQSMQKMHAMIQQKGKSKKKKPARRAA